MLSISLGIFIIIVGFYACKCQSLFLWSFTFAPDIWCNMFLLDYRLDVYIHDYLVKRDLKATAQAFLAEGKVSSDPVGKQKLERKDKSLYELWIQFFHLQFFWNTGTWIFQLLMLLVAFCSRGGLYFGTYSLLGQMRSTQRLLHRTLRSECEHFLLNILFRKNFGLCLIGFNVL